MAKLNTDRFRKYLEEKGVNSALHLAEETGISIYTILKLKSGTSPKNPSRLLIRSLVQATGIPEGELLSPEASKVS